MTIPHGSVREEFAVRNRDGQIIPNKVWPTESEARFWVGDLHYTVMRRTVTTSSWEPVT